MARFIKKPAILLLLTGILFWSCSKTVYHCVWQMNPVTIDGKSNEWGSPLRYYDSSSKLQYAFSNDMDNLYLCIKVTDKSTQFRIKLAGMELRIDTISNMKKHAVILFPLPGKENMIAKPPQDMQRIENNQKPMMEENFKIENSMMQLTGFKEAMKETVSITDNEYGIRVCINTDNSGMYYEAAIPFNTFFKRRISLSDSTKTFGLSIVINAMSMPSMPQGDKSEMSGGMGGGMPGGGGMGGGMPDNGMPSGGPPGGGRGGAMPGGGPPSGMGGEGTNNSNSQATNLNLKFKIAVKP